MNISVTLLPAEAQRAIYEYLVRRGYPSRLKVEAVAGPRNGPDYTHLSAEISLEPCAQCENTTVIEGIGNRQIDCACVEKNGADA